MIPQKKTWKEKRLAREECSSDMNSVDSDMELGSGNIGVNMVFHLP